MKATKNQLLESISDLDLAKGDYSAATGRDHEKAKSIDRILRAIARASKFEGCSCRSSEVLERFNFMFNSTKEMYERLVK